MHPFTKFVSSHCCCCSPTEREESIVIIVHLVRCSFSFWLVFNLLSVPSTSRPSCLSLYPTTSLQDLSSVLVFDYLFHSVLCVSLCVYVFCVFSPFFSFFFSCYILVLALLPFLSRLSPHPDPIYFLPLITFPPKDYSLEKRWSERGQKWMSLIRKLLCRRDSHCVSVMKDLYEYILLALSFRSSDSRSHQHHVMRRWGKAKRWDEMASCVK